MRGNKRLYRRWLCVLLPLVLCTCILFPIRASHAEEERSKAWAYSLATAGVLIPAWTSLALLPKDDRGFRWTGRWVGSLGSMYLAAAWGTSVGYYYSGNTSYATWSGIGKSALIGAALGSSLLFEKEGQHPYLIGLSAMAITAWSFVDYVLLYRDVNLQNERRLADSSLPLLVLELPTRVPHLRVSNDAVLLSIGGGF